MLYGFPFFLVATTKCEHHSTGSPYGTGLTRAFSTSPSRLSLIFCFHWFGIGIGVCVCCIRDSIGCDLYWMWMWMLEVDVTCVVCTDGNGLVMLKILDVKCLMIYCFSFECVQ